MVTTFTRTLPSVEATDAMGLALAELLRPGDVVALRGELGAGKTTLVRAIAIGLGVDARAVSSPTYVVINQYDIPVGTRPLAGGQLLHIDAYRLHGAEDLESLGWDRLFDADTRLAAGLAAAVVEWPERIAPALPDRDRLADIELVDLGRDARRMKVTLPSTWSTRPGYEWFVEREPILCRTSKRWVPPNAATYPFTDQRAKDADLYGWLSGSYTTSREVEPTDEPEEPA